MKYLYHFYLNKWSILVVSMLYADLTTIDNADCGPGSLPGICVEDDEEYLEVNAVSEDEYDFRYSDIRHSTIIPSSTRLPLPNDVIPAALADLYDPGSYIGMDSSCEEDQ